MPVGPLTFSVGTEAELRAAIFQVSNAAAGGSAVDAIITLTANIDLSQSLPMIRGDLEHTITIDGDGYTIDAKETGRVFFVESGKVEISDVTIANAVANGGDGGDGGDLSDGGGGGLGAGAALFVNAGAEVTISGVNIVDASAAGGAGGSSSDEEFAQGGGGGGGLGGDGGAGGIFGGGGGGGYEGNGGGAVGASGGGGGEFGHGGGGTDLTQQNGGGGGGGQQGDGGIGGYWGGGGGGGVGADDDGADASLEAESGMPGAGSGGGGSGGAGYSTREPGAAGADFGGGGGGGADSSFYAAPGGAGGDSGGGGGAAYEDSIGGAGGLGGGGGGGDTGGNGGDFGGGGGGRLTSGGGGGFGGGGGGGGKYADGGGSGGFGGGGGGGGLVAGTGGTYGGTGGVGASADGGGGAGLGGAIFVRDGGTLTIKDGGFSGTFAATGGTTGGGGGATAGEAHGDVMFINGGRTATVFEVTADKLVTIDTRDPVTYDPSVGGIAGEGGIEKTGAGSLFIAGTHTYAGLTSVTAGTFEIAATLSSAISVTGGTFAGSGSVAGIKVGSGSLAPGHVPSPISLSAFSEIGSILTKSLTLGEGATFEVDVAYVTEKRNDIVTVTGAVKIDGALSVKVLGDLDADEETFTIIDNDDDDVVEGTFDGLAEGATIETGGRTFKISYVGGDGNDVTLSLTDGAPPPEPPTGVVIKGTARNDRIDSTHTPKGQPFAGNGSDTIFGKGGNDRIRGHAGDDTIIGGAGADQMWGDAGEDTFAFRSLVEVSGSLKFRGGTSPSDHIFGFVRGEDRIDLSKFDASIEKGIQHFTFIGKQGFHGEAGELRYTANGAKTVVLSGDVNGDGRADFNIVVHGPNALDVNDLILI